VQGSIGAISDALNKLSTDDIKLKIIHSSTGAISETDVMLASASKAIIIGFNVRPDARVVEIAQQEGVEIKLYDIITMSLRMCGQPWKGSWSRSIKKSFRAGRKSVNFSRCPKSARLPAAL